jgi:hypothetical protein
MSKVLVTIVSQNTLSLKVLEAYTRDVGRGVARLIMTQWILSPLLQEM